MVKPNINFSVTFCKLPINHNSDRSSDTSWRCPKTKVKTSETVHGFMNNNHVKISGDKKLAETWSSWKSSQAETSTYFKRLSSIPSSVCEDRYLPNKYIRADPPSLQLTSCACLSGACGAGRDDGGPAAACWRPPPRPGRGRRRRDAPRGAGDHPAPPPASSGCSPGCQPADRSPLLQSREQGDANLSFLFLLYYGGPQRRASPFSLISPSANG